MSFVLSILIFLVAPLAASPSSDGPQAEANPRLRAVATQSGLAKIGSELRQQDESRFISALRLAPYSERAWTYLPLLANRLSKIVSKDLVNQTITNAILSSAMEIAEAISCTDIPYQWNIYDGQYAYRYFAHSARSQKLSGENRAKALIVSTIVGRCGGRSLAANFLLDDDPIVTQTAKDLTAEHPSPTL